MTRRDLTRLLVRVFGLMILVNAAIGLPLSIEQFERYVSALGATKGVYSWWDIALIGVSYFGPFVAYSIFALCLLWWSGRFFDSASLPPEQGDDPVESIDLRNVEASLVAVLGLYFLADGFAELFRVTFRQGLTYALDGRLSLFWNPEIAFMAEGLLKLTIGALLVLRRGATVALLRSARVWVRRWRTWPH